MPKTDSIEVNASELRPALMAAMACSGADGTRPYLNSVYVTTRRGFLTLVATDAKRMAIIKTSVRSEGGPDVIVPELVCRRVARALKEHEPKKPRKTRWFSTKPAKAAELIVKIRVSPDRAKTYFEIADDIICAANVQEQFPPYERVLPKPAKQACLFAGFDAGLLATVRDVFHCAVRMSFPSAPFEPVVIEGNVTKDGKVSGVLVVMPYRLDDSDVAGAAE